MSYIEISNGYKGNKLIMLFVEGTILKPKSVFTLYSHNSYVPIGNSVKIIKDWQSQGAEIIYCTSRRNQRQVQAIARLLNKFGFVGTKLYYRDKKDKYKDIIEQVRPNVLIEDDCSSIGGSWQMCITGVDSEIKRHIKAIEVKEFKGIDEVVLNINQL